VLDWSPVEQLGFQFVIENSKDKYGGQGQYGLQDGTANLYSVDANYAVNNDWQVHAWFTRDEANANEITQRATRGVPPPVVWDATKFNNLNETGNSFGLGVKGKVSSKLKMGGDLESFRSVNQFRQSTITRGAATVFPVDAGTGVTGLPTPDVTNSLFRLKLFAQYAVQKNADLRFDVAYEKWSTNDWSYLMFPASGPTPFVYGTTTDGTSVRSDPSQNATFLGVRYIYRFN
jgi:hypothetical protein